MFNQINPTVLEKEFRNRQSDFMAETAHQSLVNKLKQVRQSEVSSHSSPRQLVGETLLNIGGWLTGTPKLKEI